MIFLYLIYTVYEDVDYAALIQACDVHFADDPSLAKIIC